MTAQNNPEARAVLIVFLVVIATGLLSMVMRAFDSIESAEEIARYATDAAEELRQEVDDLEAQVEELSDQLDQHQ